MTDHQASRLLTFNTGSSSLKAALYRLDPPEVLDVSAAVDRIGLDNSRLQARDSGGEIVSDQAIDIPDHGTAVDAVLAWVRRVRPDMRVLAAGHRLVHGGAEYREPRLITADVVTRLKELIPIDPDHLPQAITAIEAARRAYPEALQVACFDTAFHRQMPRVAQRYALPRRFADAGVVRYGFHGLSYESIMHELRTMRPAAATGRVIIAHLGNGASMVAVRDGVSVETTMGFSPTGGLVMSTRSGDLDPSVVLYLHRAMGLDAEALTTLFNRQAGLLGISEASGDMRDLLTREATDPRAAEAIAVFSYQARKFLGALAVVLGGLDTVIFTGGIGEHAAPVRARICAGLEFLGIHLDPQGNAAHAPVISREGSAVTVRVMKTDEELMIARHVYRVIAEGGASHV